MGKYSNDASYINQLTEDTGILLVNLGSPDSTSTADVRRYLSEFLSDRRIIEAPAIIWQPILHGLILRTRPRKTAHAYSKIWTEAGSPLVAISQSIAGNLEQHLNECFNGRVCVASAMRYGKPSIAAALEKLRSRGIQRILVLPLYPQYSATTTASALDAIFNYTGKIRAIPELRIVNQYYKHPAYIQALAKSIAENRTPGAKLMMSFHGLPKQNIDNGDPYQQQCLGTARLLAEQLKLGSGDWFCCFQSRFGPKQWLEPYTNITLEQLAKQGLKSIDLVCPGFPADCLETLEEINMQNRELFIENGGENYHYIPALNDSDIHIEALGKIVLDYCKDWAV